jgi:CsoR family transcriptional regulator, copper-sensing transcriptional repressor
VNQVKTQQALSRLRRIEGQIRGIQKMVEDERYCVDILTQISAVVAALHGVEDQVMENHLNTCVADAMRSDDAGEKAQKIDEIMTVVSKFRKHG